MTEMTEKIILKRLRDDVVSFDHEDIKKAARLALEKGIPPKKAINKGLAVGMEEVEKRYEKDEFFLPDLIMAGEAMNEATKILFSDKKTWSADGGVIIATVKGDIHDIGKNILSNFLCAAGIGVHDMGVDVETEDIINAVQRLRPKVLALSAMLSNTGGEIKEVIKELEERGLKNGLKIIVGGAGTNRLFARLSGADAYSKDSVQGTIIIKKWMEEKTKKSSA